MTTSDESVPTLSRAIDQAGDVLASVREAQLGDPTPCDGWDVATLAGHLVEAPGKFLAASRGEEVQWGADPAPLPVPGWAEEFRERGDDLLHHWHQAGDEPAPLPVGMQTAELAVHTWDLARAIGYDRPLDEGVAKAAHEFMSASLKPEMRGDAFAEQVEVADDASYVDRLAAFAGRQP